MASPPSSLGGSMQETGSPFDLKRGGGQQKTRTSKIDIKIEKKMAEDQKSLGSFAYSMTHSCRIHAVQDERLPEAFEESPGHQIPARRLRQSIEPDPDVVEEGY